MSDMWYGLTTAARQNIVEELWKVAERRRVHEEQM